MILFPLLRKAFNTLRIFYIAVFSAIGGYVILLAMALAGNKNVFPFFVPGFFIMGAVGILNVIVTIFLANTVDYGELKNSRRDESVIFSMQTFVVKAASGLSVFAAGIGLDVIGLVGNTDETGPIAAQSASTLNGLRLIMTIFPLILLAAAFIFFTRKFILSDKVVLENSQKLASKNK